MEILSTGGKIKRARIYKGYTLKDICGDKISISKMSCIENDKAEAEEWIIEHISELLNLDKEYLMQNIREQIIQNISFLEGNKSLDNYEQEVLYSLGFAEKYEYYDLCFKLIHLIFNYHIDRDEIEKVQGLTSKYYEYYQKCYDDENYLTYYMDIARFLFSNKDFSQAANYYNNVRKSSKEKNKLTILAKATYNEAACYIMLRNYERAYEIAVRLKELVEYMDKDLGKAEVYHMLAMLSLIMDKGKFEEYESKSYELYGYNRQAKSKAIYNYAATMFDVKLNEKAMKYIKNALTLYPKDNKEKLVKFMLLVIDELIDNDILEYAQEICDEALDNSISLDNIEFIEESYYLKSRILQKQDNFLSAEMYMNLSLDALLKFGTKKQIYKRYMEMGYMYSNLSQVSEALKYFNLAIIMEKKM